MKEWFGKVPGSSELDEQNQSICSVHILLHGTIQSTEAQARTFLRGSFAVRSVRRLAKTQKKKTICVMKIVVSFFAVEVRTNCEKKYVNILDVSTDESNVPRSTKKPKNSNTLKITVTTKQFKNNKIIMHNP